MPQKGRKAPQPIRCSDDGRFFLGSCPVYLWRSPAIDEAWSAKPHWDKGQLQLLYPNGVPIILLTALRQLEAGLNAGQKMRMDEMKPSK